MLQPVLEAPVLRFCASIYWVIWILKIWQEGLGRLSCCCAFFVIWHHIDLQSVSFNSTLKILVKQIEICSHGNGPIMFLPRSLFAMALPNMAWTWSHILRTHCIFFLRLVLCLKGQVFRDWSNTLPHFPCQPITLQPVLEAPVLRFCASIYWVIWILKIWQEGLGRLSCCCALFVIWHHIDLQWASFNFEHFGQTNRNMFPWQWTNHVFAKVIICNGFAKYGFNLEPYFANSLHILAYAWFSVCKESVCC